MQLSDLFSTRMSGKMKGIISLNSSPLDNPFCEKMSSDPNTVCSHCYSRGMLRGIRKQARPKFKRIGELLSKPLVVIPTLPQHVKVARFSAHGELMNLTHLENYFKIAKMNQHVLFTLWSKRFDLVPKIVAPRNVIKIYSNPRTDTEMKSPPKGFHKVFNVFSAGYLKTHRVNINCAKSCLACMLCYSRNTIKVINEQLK